MPRKPEPQIFSKNEQLTYQRRFSSYLRDYEYRNNLSGVEVSKIMDIAPQKYSDLKSSLKPYGKLINSLGFLVKIANLKGFELIEFIYHLEGKKLESRGVPQWLEQIKLCFDRLPYNLKNQFVLLCKNAHKDNFEKMKILLKIVGIISVCDISTLKNIQNMLKSLTNK